jgi:hypothetical protein
MRATRLSKLQLKAMRADANTVANIPLAVEGVSGQTAQLATFTNAGVTAGLAVGKKTIIDSAATALFDVAIANNSYCGGTIFATIYDTDDTDFQAMQVTVNYAAVDKAGTKTLAITDLATTDAKAVSSGTLTLTWTLVTGTGKATVKLQPTGSLTETAYTVAFVVIPVVGAVTLA